MTTNPVEAPLTRIPVESSPLLVLGRPSRLMVDKVSAVPRARLRRRVGALGAEETTNLNRAIVVFLGLGG